MYRARFFTKLQQDIKFKRHKLEPGLDVFHSSWAAIPPTLLDSLDLSTLTSLKTQNRTGPSVTRHQHLHHEAMLLSIVRHQDDVAVGGPDEAGKLQVVLGSRGGGLHRRNLVRLDATQLRSRVQHADLAQQTGVHLWITTKVTSVSEGFLETHNDKEKNPLLETFLKQNQIFW